MLVRAIALSIALLIGVGVMVPLATEYAEAGSKKTRKYKKKREWRGVKKYSKRWWQLYRAQERRKKLRAAQRRKLRLRQVRLAKAREAQTGETQAKAPVSPAKKSPAVLPTGQAAPQNWAPASANNGEVSFKVAGNSGMEVGSASISVVGPATGDSVSTGRNQSVGGVSTLALRRDVINKMVRENGWVVNDYQKEIGGKPVYVVVAQSQSSNGRIQSRLFYFTEADGRIYSVAANSNSDAAEKLAEESEKVVNSLQRGRRTAQQAAARE